MNQPLHACGSWTSIYKCHCHDASTTVAPDHPQMETACHGEQCNRGKIQVNAVSLLIWGGSTLPLLPHSKHMNLLVFVFVFGVVFLFVCFCSITTKPALSLLKITKSESAFHKQSDYQLLLSLETCGMPRPCHAPHLKAQRNSRHCTFS